MKKILITGGAGFIGSNLALLLISKGFEVTVLDNLSTQIHGDNPEETSSLYKSILNKVNFIKGTVTAKSDLENAIAGQDIIVHYAAETGTGQSMYEIAKYTEVNIQGTALMLDILANTKHQVKKIILASSRSIYGEGKYYAEDLDQFVYPKHRLPELMDNGDFEVKYPDYTKVLTLVPTDEESKIHPSSVYGITKQNQEQMIMTVCPTIGIAPVAFRYQNVYGPGQSLLNPYTGILSIFSTLIKNNKSINIFEDGKESRDFVFIDDVIYATYLGIVNDDANGQVFNVGAGVATDVLTVAKTLIKQYGNDVATNVSGNYRIGDIRHNYADLTKIKKALGFSPSVDFETGITKFVKWVNGQEISAGKYEDSIHEMKEKGLLNSFMAKVGLVTVLFNSDTVLQGFFESLAVQNFSDYHLYLIDNTSNDVTDELLLKLASAFKITNYTHIKNATNVGVAKGNNQGIELSIKEGSKYTLLLNNDIEFTQPNILSDIVSYAENNSEAIIIPKIYFYDSKKVWMAGGKFLMYKGSTIHIGEGHNDGPAYNKEAYFKYAPTCFMLIDNNVFKQVGIMDEKYFVYYDDTDFMYRAWQSGYKVKLLPLLHIYHKVSALTGGTESLFSIYYGTRNRIYFIGKNLKGIPYAVSMFFTITTRFIKYLSFTKQQRKELIKGLDAGFKLLK